MSHVLSDSDETVGPDSDETLPPDSPDPQRFSPDLFDADEVLGAGVKHNMETIKLSHNRSMAHEISNSESDDEPVRQRTNSNSSRHKHRDSKPGGTGKSLDISSVKKTKLPDERRKFIDDFLNMSESDSDIEVDTKRNKSKSSGETKKSKGSTPDCVRNKPHKQNYARPFLSDSRTEESNNKIKLSNSGQKSKTPKQHSNSQDNSPKVKHRKEHTSELSKKNSAADFKKSDKGSTAKAKYSENKDDLPRSNLSSTKALFDEQNDKNSPVNKKRARSPVPQELRKAVTEILNQNASAKRSRKPQCKYGDKCYRKNPSHFEEFSHKSESDDEQPSTSSAPPRKKSKLTPNSSTSSDSSTKVSRSSSPKRSTSPLRSKTPPKTPKTVKEKFKQAQPYSFFLTKVTGISDKYNSSYVMDIKDLLSPEMGNLTASCQFNFMFDIPWLMKQYPPQFRSKPLLIVHGEKGPSMTSLQASAMHYSNIRFCQAKLEIMYGTHHTKMMLLLYETGMRVIIHTSNLIENDWFKKTQGMWISPLFPRLPSASQVKGDSPTNFKHDLIEYLSAYKAYQLKEWVDHIAQHDMSSAKVVIIGSVPGRHAGDRTKYIWGHLKLRRTLQQHGPSAATVKAWPAIGQFSSIGSMGPNKENWLCGEWLQSLSTTKSGGGLQNNARLQLIFPSKDNVRLSLEGFPAGGSIPYSVNTAKKQTYLHEFFHTWKSEGRGRTKAMPHIKTYIRPMQDGSKAAWFCVTSSNLSKAAWGALEKKGDQLMIRSYEIGVLFLPKFFKNGEEIFKVTSDPQVARSTDSFLLPYDVPLQLYEKKDRPWMWDIPYVDLPDTNGNIWCPFSK